MKTRTHSGLLLAGVFGLAGLSFAAVADDDLDGLLSVDSLETIEAIMAQHQNRVDKFDIDGDDAISLSEYVEAERHGLDRIDVDGDGILELSDYEQYEQQQIAAKRQRKLDRLDLNNDGIVTMDEARQAKFQRLDHDDDGLLTIADIEGKTAKKAAKKAKQKNKKKNKKKTGL